MQSLFFLARPDLGNRKGVTECRLHNLIRTETDDSNKNSRQPNQWHEEQEAAEAEAQRKSKEHQCGITCGWALAPPSEQADDQKKRQPASAQDQRCYWRSSVADFPNLACLQRHPLLAMCRKASRNQSPADNSIRTPHCRETPSSPSAPNVAGFPMSCNISCPCALFQPARSARSCAYRTEV